MAENSCTPTSGPATFHFSLGPSSARRCSALSSLPRARRRQGHRRRSGAQQTRALESGARRRRCVPDDEIYELGAGAPGRETYHMDIAPDDGTIVDDYSYARGARVCRMRYPGDSDEEEEFFGDDDDD